MLSSVRSDFQTLRGQQPRLLMNHLEESIQLKNSYYVLRHGKSIANEEALIVSHPDDGVGRYGLAEEGRRQVAHGVEQAMREYGLDASTIIVSSDFRRTRETAEIARDILGADELILTPRLRERFFGVWDRQHNSNYQQVWDDDLLDPHHKNGGVESTSEVLSRTTALIRDLEDRYAGSNILVVSHGDALQILQSAFERVPSSQHRSLRHLETGEIRKLHLKANIP